MILTNPPRCTPVIASTLNIVTLAREGGDGPNGLVSCRARARAAGGGGWLHSQINPTESLTLVYLGYVFQKERSESPAIMAYRR
jgi:hypothetical protein